MSGSPDGLGNVPATRRTPLFVSKVVSSFQSELCCQIVVYQHSLFVQEKREGTLWIGFIPFGKAKLVVHRAELRVDLPVNARNVWSDRSIEERIDAKDADKLAIAEP